MRPGNAQNYPSYEGDHEQEAARFLASDFDSYGEIIRGMTDLDRLNAWTEVAKELDQDEENNIDCSDARHQLRKRRRALQPVAADADEAFTAASEIGDAAVADGGAVVEESDDTPARELGADQEWQEYQDEAAFESAKNDQRRTVWDLVTTVEEAEDALDREYAKDTVPRHTVELLEERLEEIDG